MRLDFPLFPEQASTVAGRVDTLYFFLVAVAVLFSTLIFVLVGYFAVKYRRRSDAEWPRPIPGDHRLELLWTAVPLGITMIMFGWGANLYVTMFRPPAEALEISVVGKQWMWKFQHPGGQREINALHVPTGRPVKLLMTSEDVIHSFFVPAFRIKMDVLPGRYTTTWFEATKAGAYHSFCAEYCGTQHSGMIGQVVALTPAHYERWLAGGAPAESPASAGARLFQQLGCDTCHRADTRARGPSLDDLFGTRVRMRDGATVVADEGYLRESILSPNARIVAGYQPVMPTFRGQISEEGLLQIVAYIKSLARGERAKAR
ncbi:MAG: cytochrome c oxidase subunit II [Candidatus Methylomirabilaceae bacterium]